MKQVDIAKICEDRPQLQKTLEERRIQQVWLLNDQPTDEAAYKQGKKTFFLLAERKDGFKYFIQSVAGTKSKDDKFYFWIANDMMQQGSTEPDTKDYILIDKSKLGRKKRELTDAERKQIQTMREMNMSINKIAGLMKISNRKVMQCVKELEEAGILSLQAGGKTDGEIRAAEGIPWGSALEGGVPQTRILRSKANGTGHVPKGK